MKSLSLLVGLTFLTSCSHHTINNVDYQKHNAFTAGKVVTGNYVEVGPAVIEKSDFVFKSCESLASEAMNELSQQAKARGGNSLHNVLWEDQYDRLSPIPTCRIRWGWFAAFGVGGLGPWVKYVKVSASISQSEKKVSKAE